MTGTAGELELTGPTLLCAETCRGHPGELIFSFRLCGRISPMQLVRPCQEHLPGPLNALDRGWVPDAGRRGHAHVGRGRIEPVRRHAWPGL